MFIPGAVIVGGTAFIAGFQEVLGGRVTNGNLIIPMSCAIGAGVGAVVSDYLLGIKSFGGDSKMGMVLPDMIHAFLWALVANFLVDSLSISNGVLITSAAGGVGAYMAHAGQGFMPLNPLKGA